MRRPRTVPIWTLVALALALGATWAGVATLGRRRAAGIRSDYARVWSGRLDGALEFRLADRPWSRYLVLLPSGYRADREYPLWVTLHGITGTAEDGLEEWYHLARHRGAILLAPHGSTVLHNPKLPHTSSSYWHLESDPQDVVRMVDEVRARYGVDDRQVALFATSAGAGVALTAASLAPRRFSFLSMIGEDFPDDASLPATADRDQLRLCARSMRVFYGRGLSDVFYRKADYAGTVRTLRRLGFRVEARALSGVGHDDRPFRNTVLAFYDRCLGKRPPVHWTLDLSGVWRARFVHPIPDGGICHDDPGASTEAVAATQPGYDDAKWQEVPVPHARSAWAGAWGSNWNGEVVLRRRVVVPASEAGQSMRLGLGMVEALDAPYFNGVKLGETTVNDPYWLYRPREYVVPRRLIHAGVNLIAVRLFDRCGGGGLTAAGPGDLALSGTR